MLLEAFWIEYLIFGKPALPHFSQVSEFLCQAMRESALDELHGLFDRHSVSNAQQKMYMVGHDYEIMEFELCLCHKRSQHVDQKGGIAFRLQ